MGENFKTLCEGAYYEDAEGRKYGPMTLAGTDAYPYNAKDERGGLRYFNKAGENYCSQNRNLVRVLPDEDGWYPHVPGDPRPVEKDVIVEAILRSGIWLGSRDAGRIFWGASEQLKDKIVDEIIKYRIVNKQKSPQASGPGDHAQPAVMNEHDTPADASSGGNDS